MESEKILFESKYIALKQTARGFQYLERKGRDSVAMFLIRRNSSNPNQFDVLIRYQPLCIDTQEINGTLKLFPCPFTGSLSKGESPEVAAHRETFEESGYSVQLSTLGKYIIGTQTNEICYLFYADVTGIEPQAAPNDGTYFESISKNEWQPLDYLLQCDYSACQIGYLHLKAVLGL